MAGPGDKIFCALDTPDLASALSLTEALIGKVGGVKLGLEFFSALGTEGIQKISALGLPLFLDLKLHDIPNTVAKAIHALIPLNPKMLTIHACGGLAMMKAAKQASLEAATKNGIAPPLVLGVTVLTSLDDKDLKSLGVGGKSTEQVLRLAGLAAKAGLDGVVCSPLEIETLRKKLGRDLKLVVPGIRPEGASMEDQKRVMTPKRAIDLGADFLVIGRPITAAKDPARAAREIAGTLAGN